MQNHCFNQTSTYMNNPFKSKKIALFFLLFTYLSFQKAFAQCTNPPLSGSASQSFCKASNPSVRDLVATGGSTIVWYNSPTGGTAYSNSTPLANGFTYYADNEDGGGCSTPRLAVTVTIYGYPPSNVDVFVGKCINSNPTIADLNATGTNIQWYDAQNGGNLLSITTPLVDNTTYWVQQTENGCVSSRLPTTVSLVNPPPPTAESVQTFCSSLNPTVANLQASESNVVWYSSETSNTVLDPTTPLINGADYWGAQISFPCEGTQRSKVTAQIDDSPDAGTDGSLTVCEVDLVTTNLFDLLGGNPDTTGTWSGPSALSNGYLGTFEPGINTAGIYTYTVKSALGICADATAAVTVTINVVPPPTTTENLQTFCEIDNPTVASLSASGTGILWYDSETSISPLIASTPLIDGNSYWATQTDTTSSCSSKNRLKVTVSIVKPLPPTTVNSTQTFCEINNPTVADLNASGNAVTWYDSLSSTTPLSSTEALIDGTNYYASQKDLTTGCESATRLAVNVQIINIPPPTTTSVNQVFCENENPTIANLNISGTNVVWYDTQTSTAPLDSTTNLINGEDYWAAESNTASGCESAQRTVVNVTVNSTPPATVIATTQTFCAKDFAPNSPTVADLDASGNEIKWYDSETSTTPLTSTDFLVNRAVYWVTQTDAITNCESAVRVAVTAIVSNPPTPTTSNQNQNFCLANNPTVADLQTNSSNVVWYDSDTATTPLNTSDALINGKTYWAAESDTTAGCESISRLQVTATITDTPSASFDTKNQQFCTSNKPTIADLQVNGNGIVWYASETSTTPLNLSDLLIDGNAYWAVQTDANTGCESSVRVETRVVLTDPGTPTANTKAGNYCVIDKPTLATLNADVVGNSNGPVTWYDAYPNGTVLNLSDLLVDGTIYYALINDATNCSSANPLAITVRLDACEQYDIISYDGFSPTGNGINDSFKITNLKELYPNFKVEFFNRWGNKVYSQDASKPDWNGRLNGKGELVPAGVYYYIIYFNKNNRQPIQKTLYISR